MSCANENCTKRAIDSPNAICVNVDGDFVCDEDCEKAYKHQKHKFFSETVHSEEATLKYLKGE